MAPNLWIQACRATRAGRRCSGYTLLELLLVLAILVAVASAVAPTVVARMAEYRLKRGAEATRFAIAAARVHAIDLSSVYQFRYEPGGRRYLAVPTEIDAAAGSAGALPPSAVVSGQLPEDLSFKVATVVGPAVLMPVGSTDADWAGALARVSNAGDFSSATWSPPIIFRPDGTAVDAALNVVDQHGDGYELRVRELTGEVFVTHLGSGTL
jgi:prepilin-type N-terminal cleavage/methylation domain-containing protein